MIVFFDIDGTIISDDGKNMIPESAVRAIRAARGNGHLMYINTGRTYMNVEPPIREIGFDGYICGCGTYIQCGDDVILNRTVPRGICEKITRLVRECDMTPVYERFDALFTDKTARILDGLKDLLETFKSQGKDLSRDASDADFGFDKFVVWYDEKSDLDKFKRGIAENFDFIDRGWGFCELAPKGFSKGAGIKIVCEHLGVSENDTIAIGDSLNDTPMLDAAKISVAMGNSVKELLDTADFVTRDLYDGGIEYALRRFGLI